MKKKISLETASSIALISRQLGAVVSNEQVGEAFESGYCCDQTSVADYFEKFGISIYFKKIKKKDISKKSYLFPLVAIKNDGSASVLISTKLGKTLAESFFQIIDVFSSTLGAEKVTHEDFFSNWLGHVVLVGRKSEVEAQQRLFDFDWFFPELLRFKWLFFMAFLMSLLLHTIAFAPIIFIQISLDKVVGYQATSTLYVLTAGVGFALIFSGIMGYLRDYIVNLFGSALDARLSGDLFDKILRLPIHLIDGANTKLEEASQSVSSIKSYITRNLISAAFDVAGLLIFLPILFLYSPLLGIIVLGFSIVLAVLSYFFKNIEKNRSNNFYKEESAKLKVLRETIAGIDNVKSLSQEPIQRRAWREATFKSIQAAESRDNINAVSTNINSVINQAMTIVIIFVGIQLVFLGSLSAGAIIAVNMVAARVVRPVGILISSIGEIDRLRTGVNRISEIWNSTPERKVVGTAIPIKGGFVFNEVSLNLGGKEILKKITFEITPGALVAVVGPAASGKTTLFKVLQGFIQPTTGSVLIDGRSLSSLDLENYRSQVSLVHSNPSFFMGSIEENLRRARRNISERELNEAISLSGLDKILPDIEGGLSYRLDNASNSLPNSYRQIIAISRALVNNSKVLLFDEVFSSLDKKIQVELLTNLRKLAKNKTLLLVTHDLRIAKELDSILVMDDGEIVGHGVHEELKKSVPVYKNLWLLDNLSKVEEQR